VTSKSCWAFARTSCLCLLVCWVQACHGAGTVRVRGAPCHGSDGNASITSPIKLPIARQQVLPTATYNSTWNRVQSRSLLLLATAVGLKWNVSEWFLLLRCVCSMFKCMLFTTDSLQWAVADELVSRVLDLSPGGGCCRFDRSCFRSSQL
jgi:hypothetical protein